MPKFTTDVYPSLQVKTEGGRVVFANGEAEASGKAAEGLRALPESYGVTEVKGGGKKAADSEDD